MRKSESIQPIAKWFDPLKIGLLFTVLLLARNAWLYWMYSYAFYPDSNLYVHLGAGFFKTWSIGALVTFPYPLLNALTASYADPDRLIWFQVVFSALAGGFVVYVVARKDRLFAGLLGLLLAGDLVWGASSRTILTDGMFATVNLLALGLLLLHFDRRRHIPGWELVLAGVLYALAVSFRPSNIFLAVLFPPIYLWLTRSWRKTLSLVAGFVIFFTFMGLINLKGTNRFFILDSGQSYTDDYLAFPLFIYRLYSPENGPASQKIDTALQACYPGLDYTTAVDRIAGGAFDSANNMNFIVQKVFPCLQSAPVKTPGMVRSAYLEALKKLPGKFSLVMAREMAIFLRYGNPYILRFALAPSRNYGCSDTPWCDTLHQSRGEWDTHAALTGLYEKVSVKLLQAYLAPVGIFSRLSPDKEYTPYLLAWVLIFALTMLITRGRLRFFAIASAGLVLYTAAVVVVALGFNERYAAMLSPIQTVLSAVFWVALIRWADSLAAKFFSKARRNQKEILPADGPRDMEIDNRRKL